LLILMITVALSVLSYRRGWDLDSVSTPMVTALGDMATLPTLYLATFLVRDDTVNAVVSGLCVLAALYAIARAYSVNVSAVRRIVLEMTAVILLTPVLDILAGTLQEHRLTELTAIPVLLILIPPFVSQAGALGGIFASRISSKLQIGVITPRGLPETPALVDGTIVFGLAIVVFSLIGTIAVGLSALTGQAPISPWRVITGSLAAGMIATPVTIVVSYYLAIVTYRFGLDPDNQTVPIITSVMDLAGVACVLFVMSVSGVLPHG
jgi:mgtE-like transporter